MMKKFFEMLLSGLLALWNRIKEPTPRTQSTNDQTGKGNTNLTVTGSNSIVIVTGKSDKDDNDLELIVKKSNPPPKNDSSSAEPAKSDCVVKPVAKVKKTVRKKTRHKKPRH